MEDGEKLSHQESVCGCVCLGILCVSNVWLLTDEEKPLRSGGSGLSHSVSVPQSLLLFCVGCRCIFKNTHRWPDFRFWSGCCVSDLSDCDAVIDAEFFCHLKC